MNASSQVTDHNPKSRSARWIRRTTRILFAGFLCWLIVRTFAVQVMHIPSSSMEGTLHKGDKIYVNKLVHGPRVPITILSIPFSEKHLDWIQLPYWRIPGYNEININDILVFNLPTDTSKPIDCRSIEIMRCAGLPGDNIRIVRSELYVNGELISSPTTITKLYIVNTRSRIKPDSLFSRIGITEPHHALGEQQYAVLINRQQADQLKISAEIESVVLSVLDADRYDYKLFPQNTSKSYRWNLDNFGAVEIPKKGKPIRLTLDNIHIYKTAITIHEGNTLENRNDSIFINGKYTSSYLFKQDYYFVLGDNRYHSHDSRYWGFVPESHLIGTTDWRNSTQAR